MTWDNIDWDELEDKVRARWAKLSDDDCRSIAGKKGELIGKLRQRYGMRKEEAEREIDNFIRSL